jgi:DNA-binding NtrC family response regulator
MTGSRVAIVVEDQRLGGQIQATLKKSCNHLSHLSKFESIRTHLGRDTDGVLILVATAPPEAEQALRLVQEICIQELPLTVVLLTTDTLPPGKELAMAEPHVAARLRWPEDTDALIALVRDRSVHARTFLGTREETLEEVIRRRLLSMTPSLMPMVDRIGLAAAHDVTVLLTGETGTGKTYLARLMHDCSPRKHHPFLAVPCGAQPANLVESAFFGHIKGAFTGADRAKIGKFAAAGNGTLLLDEIDTLGLEQQAALLRVIETGEYEPVGSNETQICTARIIVASNWNLEEAAKSGRFRQDLYYRLNVMSFHLPAVRERKQDIEPLVRGMAARFNTKFRKDLFDISKETLRLLEVFPWPGNIRQMENAVQQAVLVSSGRLLLPEHLPQPIRDYIPPQTLNGHYQPVDESLSQSIDAVERNVIQKALERHGNSRARAAESLGISRVTLYKKMKKYGLMPSSVRGESRVSS